MIIVVFNFFCNPLQKDPFKRLGINPETSIIAKKFGVYLYLPVPTQWLDPLSFYAESDPAFSSLPI